MKKLDSSFTITAAGVDSKPVRDTAASAPERGPRGLKTGAGAKRAARLGLLGLMLRIGLWSHAASVTVDTSTDVVDGNTTSIANLLASKGADTKISLREAVIAANNTGGPDTILFSSAINGTPITLTRSGNDADATLGDLDINDSVTITGNGANNTIIQGATAYNPATGVYTGSIGDKIFGINQDGTHSGLTVSISGVTIRWGQNTIPTSDPLYAFTGAGVDVYLTGTGNTTTFTDCVITENSNVNSYGGGVNVDSTNQTTPGGASAGTVTFTRCTITNNRSKTDGAGLNLYADIHTVNLTDCVIAGNTTTGTGGNYGNGGGIDIRHTYGGSVSITGGWVTNNSAAGMGGGIAIVGNQNVSLNNVVISTNTSTTTSGGSALGGGLAISTWSLGGYFPTINVSGCTISGNHADNGSAAQGGGVYFGGVYSATLSGCPISGNTADNGAGVANDNITSGITLTLSGCSIESNTATGNGGGLANNNANSITALINATFSGNTATLGGGGIYSAAGTISMVNVTLANNRADNDNNGTGTGGGINRTGGTVTLKNTLVAGNFNEGGATDPADDINGSVDATSSYNLIGTGGAGGLSNGVNNNQVGVADPRLGPLQNNGGPTQTHALLVSSPALDAGSNALVPGGVTTDQRGTGFARILDAADAGTTQTVDIGAYEAHPMIEDIATQAINEDGSLNLTFNLGDANAGTTPAISSVTASSANTSLVPNNPANISVSGSGATRTLTIAPAANQFGTTTITATVTTGSQSISDSFVLTVSPVADPPSVTSATTSEDIQNSSGLVISRNAADGAEVTHFKITGITGGSLFKNNGTTPINNNDFITFAEGNAGLKFTPAANASSPGTTFSFQAQGATSAAGAGLGSAATAAITVNPVADTPSVTSATTSEDTQTSSGLVISRNAVDGAEVTHFKITGITGGTLFKNNGTTPINNNDFITFAEGNAGLKFTPAANVFSPGTTFSFQAQGATSAAGAGLGPAVTATITVTAVNDPPVVGTDTVSRAKGRTVKVLKTALLANDTDVDGPSGLSIISVNSSSDNGATVRILGDWVMYEANAGDLDDNFSYTVSDGADTSVGQVNVTVSSDPSGATLNIVSDSNVSGERRFVVAGIPGRTYRLQMATNVLGPWTDVSGAAATGVASALGEALVKDAAPPAEPSVVFYRAVEP